MTFVNGSGAANHSAAHDITVPVPAGVVDGDFMIACIGYGPGAATNPDWNFVELGGAFNATILWRVASSEPSDYTFAGAAGFMIGSIFAWRGPTSLEDFATQITSPPNPQATQSLTATGAGTYVFVAFGQYSSGTPQFNNSGGTLSDDYEFDDAFLTTAIAAFSKDITGAGATGPDAFSTHVGDSNGVVGFALELLGTPAPTPPTIASLSPDHGPIGQSVVIAGTNFSTATAVDFNGTSASFTIDSAIQITATVAPGTTTGPVHVTNPDGTSTDDPIFTVAIPAATLPYRSPAWRFVVLDLVTFETLSFLDHLASGRVVTYTLDAAAQAEMVVPSANPEINIPWPDPNSDPFLTEGSRVLYGFRRDGEEPIPWTPRFAGIIMQLEDTAQSDQAYSHLTAWDPWEYLKMRPVCNIDGSLPGPNGISFTDTTVDQIIGELLRNTIENQGPVGIDMGDLYGGTTFYDGTIETCVSVSINFPQGTTLGDAWTQLTNQSDCDIVLTPIYDPTNRPGYLVQANVYNQAGSPRDDAIFAWNMPSRSLVQISRLIDGTLRANVVKFFSGLGGSATDGSTIPAQIDVYSIDKFGEYWRQQFFPAQNIADIVKLLAQAELALSKNGRTTVTISPAPERSPIPFDDYFLGDEVPVYASNALRAPLAGYQRIYGIPLNIGDDATESVQQLLTTEPAST
jgi:IPT/TIG domain